MALGLSLIALFFAFVCFVSAIQWAITRNKLYGRRMLWSVMLALLFIAVLFLSR